ncbi:MAG: aminotransferase class V-fold PLP-dependent enzyme [Myxococcales bacterium]|nr:aminotransferase class V-fold PLP-dependent enzyme [Myxococcales bacterium]
MDARFQLDPTVTFLNHGSFGATPVAVLAAQRAWQDRLEAEPVRFFLRELPPALAEVRARLGAFLGADPDDLALVTNASTGVNTVLRSLEFASGDELLTTDHEYNACKNALDFVAGRSGARVVVVEVPFPLAHASEVTERLLRAVTPRTRLALVDHVTSQTGLVFPIAEIVRALEARDVDVLVDGAHAPGMVPLDLAALGAAYYTGNCHKWLCTPKGAALLHVRRDRQAGIRPLVISHGANAPLDGRTRFRAEFDWCGTSDPSAWLAIPTAIDHLASLVPGGFSAVMRQNRALALEARDLLCAALGVERPAPDDMIGALAALPLPDGDGVYPPPLYLDALQERLWLEHRIEVPIIPWPRPPKRLVRVSAQLHNTRTDYEKLAAALLSLLR